MRRALRLLYHLARLVPLIFLGAIVRYARRLSGRKPRIWHGMSPLFWEPYLVQTSAKAGYPVRFVLRDSPMNREWRAEKFPDLRLVGEREAHDEIHWAVLRDLFWRGDIQMAYFDIFYFGPSLRWANELTLQLLKLAGIKIIVMPHGGDVTYRTRHRTRFDWVGRVQQNNPAWDLVASAPYTSWRIETYCKYADLVLAGSEMRQFVPRSDLCFMFVAMDTDEVAHAPVKTSGTPIVVHAPSSRAIKGTENVLAALESLKAKGIDFELRLVEKRPRPEALQIYSTADVVIDQLCIGGYGTLAVESLSLGKPTLTYLDHEHLGDPVFNAPVINANPENVEQVLAVLLQVGELRRRIGEAARESAVRLHSIDSLSKIWGQIFEYLWNGTPLRLHETAQFDPSRKPRSYSEDPADVEFWPVEAKDLEGEIHAALARAGFL